MSTGQINRWSVSCARWLGAVVARRVIHVTDARRDLRDKPGNQEEQNDEQDPLEPERGVAEGDGHGVMGDWVIARSGDWAINHPIT